MARYIKKSSLSKLTRKVIYLLYDLKINIFTSKMIAFKLKVHVRRIYDIVHVLEGANYIKAVRHNNKHCFRLLTQPKNILNNMMKSYRNPSYQSTDLEQGSLSSSFSDDSDCETILSIDSCPNQQPYFQQGYYLDSPRSWTSAEAAVPDFFYNNQSDPSFQTQLQSADSHPSDFYQNQEPPRQPSSCCAPMLPINMFDQTNYYNPKTDAEHLRFQHDPYPVFPPFHHQPSVYNPYAINLKNKSGPVSPLPVFNQLSQRHTHVSGPQSNNIIYDFKSQCSIDNLQTNNNNYFEPNFNKDHPYRWSNSSQGSNQIHTLYCPHFPSSTQLQSGSYPKPGPPSSGGPVPTQFDNLDPFQKSKNLTAVVPNTKPVNTVAIPAITTGGRRRIRRVKKSRPGSLFSFAAGRKLKSRRPRKVKSSRTSLTVAGGKRRGGKRSKSRKSTGGRKVKRSKSKKSRKSKSKVTGGKRRYRKH